MKFRFKTATIAFAIAAPAILSGCATVEEGIVEAVADTHRASLNGSEIVSSNGDRDGYAQAEVSIANTLAIRFAMISTTRETWATLLQCRSTAA